MLRSGTKSSSQPPSLETCHEYNEKCACMIVQADETVMYSRTPLPNGSIDDMFGKFPQSNGSTWVSDLVFAFSLLLSAQDLHALHMTHFWREYLKSIVYIYIYIDISLHLSSSCTCVRAYVCVCACAHVCHVCVNLVIRCMQMSGCMWAQVCVYVYM